MPRTRPEIHIPANPDWVEALDTARGDKTRAYFVREILRRSLAKRGFRLSRMDDERGRYDREAKGLLSPRALAERRRRAKHREYTARWRSRQPTPQERKVAAQAAILAGFTFCDNGTVLHRDLENQGVAAGFIQADGRFTPESRFTEAMVYDGLARAMSADPAHVWPDRYALFVKRYESSWHACPL